MSTIYSAGQYDDAFTPKRLGNWESTAKESYPFRKTPKLVTPKIIVDSRGHLLPWVPRGDRTSSWGLLNLHLRNKYNRTRSMVVMSGPGKQPSQTNNGSSESQSSIHRRLKKLPKYAPRKVENGPPPDLLLEYLKHLSLPIVWIIGPSTRNTFQKRKQFSKQLASSLGYGYVNLDEKIQEWKERQQICTCGGSTSAIGTSGGPPPTSPPPGPLHSLASTSIAPSKLPTNVPPFISPNIPSPPETSTAEDANEYLLNILESQRIAFDTALPIERNKILELYKFAMAECLPCGGFIMDSMPFDLVEGLQFEKVFYPSALAIYFTEGVPQRKQRVKPKDRRVTASTTATSIQTAAKKVLMSPLDYLERGWKHQENVYLKTKSHKRLGVFSVTEGEKICKQFGSKTIRIINAEDVERDTMEFLNELVKKNLDRYKDIVEGNGKLDFGAGGQLIPCHSSAIIPVPSASGYTSSFILEDDEKAMLEQEELEELMATRDAGGAGDATAAPTKPKSRMPPALVTAHQSETSLFTLPNIFSGGESSGSSAMSSVAPSPRVNVAEVPEEVEVEVKEVDIPKSWSCPGVVEAKEVPQSRGPSFFAASDAGGAGDHGGQKAVPEERRRRKSAEIWEKIVKLESKVAELSSPEEESCIQLRESKACCSLLPPSLQEDEEEYNDHVEDNYEVDHHRLPPPTAYAEQEEYLDLEEQEKFTAAIRNAIGTNYVAAVASQKQQHHHHLQLRQQEEYHFAPPPQNYPPHHPPPHPDQFPTDYDYGASGDCAGQNQYHPHQLPYPNYQQQQRKRPSDKQRRKKSSAARDYHHSFQEDPFYDD